MHDRLEQQLSPKLLGQPRKRHFASKPILPTNHTKVHANFPRHFRCHQVPSKSRIFDWTQKFREHGTVQNYNSKGLGDTYSGRRVSARTERNIDVVRDSVGRSPKKSIRRRSQELGIPRESVRHVLKFDLNLYPYKIQIKQNTYTSGHRQTSNHV